MVSLTTKQMEADWETDTPYLDYLRRQTRWHIENVNLATAGGLTALVIAALHVFGVW